MERGYGGIGRGFTDARGGALLGLRGGVCQVGGDGGQVRAAGVGELPEAVDGGVEYRPDSSGFRGRGVVDCAAGD